MKTHFMMQKTGLVHFRVTFPVVVVVVIVIVIETVIGLTAVLDYDNDYRCADNDNEGPWNDPLNGPLLSLQGCLTQTPGLTDQVEG